MFESLSERLQGVFSRLRNKGVIAEKDLDEALREVRVALLEADVNFKVAREFLARVRERALGTQVLQGLNPAQQVIKIVNDELIATLGGGQSKLSFAGSPTVIMLVGLQGSGKTTTAAKLALQIRKEGHRPLLVAADVRRPAAIQQLITLGKQIDIPVYSEDPRNAPPDICRNAVKQAKDTAQDVVILDTAGRLAIDQQMMDELRQIKSKVAPHEVVLVADAMTGQDAVRVADEFHKQIGLTGLILTKVDGDARGGAALSIRSVTGVPIKYLAMGEKTDALEPFYPERLASRILGMGDMLSLIEKAQATFDQKQAEILEEKMRSSRFDLEDFLEQMQQLRKMGPLQQVMEMIPGMGGAAKAPGMDEAATEKQMKHIEAIIRSMTHEERQNPNVIEGRRKRRIAAGSGATVQEVNQLLNQFRQMQKLMKMASSGRLPRGLSGLMGG